MSDVIHEPPVRSGALARLAHACAARLTPYSLGADSVIRLLWATMNTPVAGKKLTIRLAYRVQA